MSIHKLSKSTYVRGLQCHKNLYLNKYKKDLRNEQEESDESVFEQGIEVGKLAQQLFPKGVNSLPDKEFDYSDALNKTAQFIKEKQAVIYEAHFLFDDVICAVDILLFDGKKYKAIEVKSSTSISDVYIQDAALQYYVLTNAGIKIKDISIAYINNQYVRKGKINPKQLFINESVFDDAKQLQDDVKSNITVFKRILNSKKEPKKDIGVHCSSPYACDFIQHCWSHIPEYSIFNIANLRTNKKFELYNLGIIEFHQITTEAERKYLNEKHSMQVFAELEQRSYIDKNRIKTFIKDLQFPLYFLDFETINTALPLFENSRPYQQIVFQYSLHYLENAKSKLKHSEYLAEVNGTDPRVKFIEQLIKECGKTGDILTYNMTFEKTRLKELAEDFPTHKKDLENIINRLKDLMIPFKERWYYTPEMRGSFSIKYVLPALVPELSYKNLEIQNGGTAMNIYAQMASGSFTGDIEKTRKALLEYCHLDTYAMVKIWEVLRKL